MREIRVVGMATVSVYQSWPRLATHTHAHMDKHALDHHHHHLDPHQEVIKLPAELSSPLLFFCSLFFLSFQLSDFYLFLLLVSLHSSDQARFHVSSGVPQRQ